LGERVTLIVDGGQCQVGIESTVFDVLANKVLRPGMISARELECEVA
jgi:L-threonylcarbamoyladenylate synthase